MPITYRQKATFPKYRGKLMKGLDWGIYEYLLDGQEKHLNIRAFSPEMARAANERYPGKSLGRLSSWRRGRLNSA